MAGKITMPKELLEKWLKALRSGEYKQAKGTLYDPAIKGFCCLGVLQHLATDGQVEYLLNGKESMAPVDEVVQAMGLPTTSFYKAQGISMKGNESALAEMNDGYGEDEEDYDYEEPRDFDQIADYIEANSEGV